MLKTVPTNQVKLGMHIHELKGAWVDHPFWKTQFVLEDIADLKKLQSSIVQQVVIDTSKGLDVDKPEMSTNKDSTALENRPDFSAFHSTSTATVVNSVCAANEAKVAKRTIDASKKAVASMFSDVRMGRAVSTEVTSRIVADIAASVSRNQNALISQQG